MRALLASCSAFILLSLSATACVDGEEGGKAPEISQSQGEVAAAGSDCEDRSFCTREYRPTTCRFQGQVFQGSNPCETMRQARRYACEKKLNFSESAVSCETNESGGSEG